MNKLKKIYIGKTKSKTKCQNLSIINQKLNNVKNSKTDQVAQEDNYDRELNMEETESEKY